MSALFSNDAELFVGDKVKFATGFAIVESVGGVSATALREGSGEPVEVANPFPKDRILERGKISELEKLKTKGWKMITLELGDRLIHGGELRTVVVVTDKTATLGNERGEEFEEVRRVNEFYFTDPKDKSFRRLNEQERADNLERFLVERKPPTGETEKNSGAEKKETKVKAKKEKKVKTNGEVKKERKGGLFGSSICRVAMTAGLHGVSYEKFVAVLGKHKLKLAEGTIRQNLKIGAAKKMKGAELTKEQLAEFGI